MTETAHIKDLVPDTKNARKHNPRNIGMIQESLQTLGAGRSILIDENNRILAGNGTIEAAAQAGITNLRVIETDGNEIIAVRRSNMTEEQKTKYGLMDNRTAELAEWDADMMKLLSEEVDLGEMFTEKELASILPKPEIDEDEAPPLPKEARTKRGDIYTLGRHRVMCGDSTDAGDVALLMDGKKADMVFTSPPYGLGKSVSLSGNKKMSKRGNAYDEHEDNPDEWAKLMRGWYEASLSVCDVWVVNIQPLAGNKRELIRWIFDRSDRLVDIATWDKGHGAPAMSEGVMSSRYEWFIILGGIGSSRRIPLSSWRGTIQNVYDAPPQRNNEFSDIHAATMPLHVPVWVITELCNLSKSIYEPFCGSGTTLIACEQTSRICYGMEISEAYCDVIVQRWVNLTGGKVICNGDEIEWEKS